MLNAKYISAMLTVLAAGSAAPGQSHPATQSQPTSQPGPQIDVSVDPRVELISLIFRLAGNPEYTKAHVPSYVKDADEHFAAFKDHPVVKTARRLRKEDGVSYDAPMSLAVHLGDAARLELLVPLDPWPEGLDERWKPRELQLFSEQARDFAATSDFQGFFDAHRHLYDQSVERMRKVLTEHAHLEWFDEFFGPQRDGRFHLALGMLNGPNCYGARLRRPGRSDMYCILGIWLVDDKGVPAFADSVAQTVVHEFAHSYVNPVVEKWTPQLEKAGTVIFPTQEKRMREMAYGTWQTMIIESMVRASEIRYVDRYQGDFMAAAGVMGQSAKGFVWMPGLAKLMAEYEADRQTYPTLDDFMPRVVEFFNDYAATLKAKP